MAASFDFSLTHLAPTDFEKGPESSLFLVMQGLGDAPTAGGLMRKLTPFLDEQGAKHVFLLTERDKKEAWSGKNVTIQELVHWAREEGEGQNGGVYRGVALPGGGLEVTEVRARFLSDPFTLVEWAAQKVAGAVVSSEAPLRLGLHYEEKPWGREGWYTGVEKRGVSSVVSATGSTPLPYAVGMFPVPLTGMVSPEIILLKTLEPIAEEVYGDLYLEVHQQKWETYLVLDVDAAAWGGDSGILRAGLSAEKLESFRKKGGDWKESLKLEMTQAIGRYEACRRKIDSILEAVLEQKGTSLAEASVSLRKEITQAEISSETQEEETTLRREAESFFGRYPLDVGDVACLPPGVIHSLQHGVKVVEFQTPTYERLIAMFAQKVLTQEHWDSEKAVASMDICAYDPQPPELLPAPAEGVVRERIVDFPQFTVERFILPPDVTMKARREGGYRLLFVSEGAGKLTMKGVDYDLAPEEAMLLPATRGEFQLTTSGDAPFSVLLAIPREREAEEESDV